MKEPIITEVEAANELYKLGYNIVNIPMVSVTQSNGAIELMSPSEVYSKIIRDNKAQ